MQKVIQQATLDGKFLAVYSSARTATNLTGEAYSTIRHGVNGRQSRNFVWSEATKALMSNKMRRTGSVAQLDASTGEVVAVYNDMASTVAATGIKESVLNRSITENRKYNGYKFVVNA